MKKTIIYTLLILSFAFFSSCKKRTSTNSFYYLKINNTTNHEVMLGLFDKENDTLLVEYFVSPKEIKSLDTVLYFKSVDDGESTVYVSGRGNSNSYFTFPYWNTTNSEMSYIFDNTKILKKLSSKASQCDTSSRVQEDLCNFGTIDLIKKEIKKGIEFEEYETVTYIITEQQYALADTI